ncbi:hypothetical protein [Kangiella sp. HZ709]|uniref:hypothetical protein n=1 Tax=Kangiella sp. HZ709 TaxID=2666328 RepID=UPI0012AF6DFD|nr:hypothetical protein [Kangiella sp. HZ709]MRX27147.1 hypothetical protein [Kangiella sp. HZ709]
MNNIKVKAVAAIFITALSSGCSFHVDKGSNADTIHENTRTAVDVCGGSDRVKSVSLEGYTCKAE